VHHARHGMHRSRAALLRPPLLSRPASAMAGQPLKICVLEMDSLERYPGISQDSRKYPQLYAKWFAKVPSLRAEQTAFNVYERGEFPEEADMTRFDLFLFTGSEHGAYETHLPWVSQTIEFIRRLRAQRRRMLGICFGHQIIAHALPGGQTVKNPSGLELGWASFSLTAEARSLWSPAIHVPAAESIDLLYAHGDHVETLPDGFVSMGGNAHTPCQGMLARDRSVLTVQGHPEFDVPVLRSLCDLDERAGYDAALIARARHSLQQRTNEAWLLDAALRFLDLPHS